MITEAHDPLALLREAREDLALAHADLDALRQTRKMSTLLARIDAALAAHDTVPPSEERVDSAAPVVEWKDRRGEYIHDDGVNRLRVYLWDDIWHWHTTVEYRADGYKHTLDEAKSAAIAAARGMR